MTDQLGSGAVDYYRVAYLVEQVCLKKIYDDGDHERAEMSIREGHPVAFLLDGFCSSTAKPVLKGAIAEILQKAGYDVVMFSYNGPDVDTYNPRDTVRQKLDVLADALDQYVLRCEQNNHYVLIGFSFGGLVVARWIDLMIKRWEEEEGESPAEPMKIPPSLAKLCGVVYIATPLRARDYGVKFSRTEDMDGASTVEQRIEEFDINVEKVIKSVPTGLIRCKVDKYMDDKVFAVEDIFQVPDIIIDRVRHNTILRSGGKKLQEGIRLYVEGFPLCQDR